MKTAIKTYFIFFVLLVVLLFLGYSKSIDKKELLPIEKSNLPFSSDVLDKYPYSALNQEPIIESYYVTFWNFQIDSSVKDSFKTQMVKVILNQDTTILTVEEYFTKLGFDYAK